MTINRLPITLIGLFLFFYMVSCSTGHVGSLHQESRDLTPFQKPQFILQGKASWYGHPFHGRKTANGERYNMYEYTAAHKSLPFGTRLLVINPDNQHSLMVRINDRGPYIPGRFLDLSYAAARDLGMIGKGVGTVWVAVYPPPPKNQIIALSSSLPASSVSGRDE